MKCRFCHEPAGWLRRACALCGALWQVYREHDAAASPADLFARFRATGAGEARIEAFLGSDPDRRGPIRDRIAAAMTNDVLAALGRTDRQSARDVERLRKRGLWKAYGQRPPD